MTLAQHPAVYERVVSEILSVVGAEGEVTYESLNQMPYLNAFIRETMRLYPVVVTHESLHQILSLTPSSTGRGNS